MKNKASVIIMLLGIVGVLWLSTAVNQQAVAVSGCCKQRQGGGPWREIRADLERCKSMNASENDDLFSPTGDTWWDLAC